MTEITDGVLATCVITSVVKNRHHASVAFPVMADNLTAAVMDAARDSITAWPAYAPTPLVQLDKVAAHCGIAAVYYKDES
ncbi:MAG: hypothetical protein VW520_01480, partial [Candidatus Puniceispirillum sp.]